LKEILTLENKIRWLDVGNGGNFERGFYYLDILPEKKRHQKKYFRKDIIHLTEKDFHELGVFDLVRLQHSFEHFEFEDTGRVLINCAKLLKKDGYLLITAPDLRIHIKKYLNNDYKKWNGFKWWAHKRIAINSPNSFYFSIFAHSMPWESHKWCYDFEGLKYLVARSKKYKKIQELKKDNILSSIPFTHNRPDEDVCLLAKKK